MRSLDQRRIARRGLLVLVLAAAPGCGRAYDFSPIEVGADATARTPKPRSNSQFLRAVYADVLGRAPESYDFEVIAGAQTFSLPLDEQAMLRGALDSLGDPTPLRDELVAGLTRSAAANLPEKAAVKDPEAFITAQFQRYLGRDPGAYELAAFAGEWESDPAVGPRTVVRALIASREYQSQ